MIFFKLTLPKDSDSFFWGCRSVAFSSPQKVKEEAAIPWTATFCARAAVPVASKTSLLKSPLTANVPVLSLCNLPL